ncbi:SUMO-interacting motif-containing protein 1 isoform X1 [Hippoglossus hippoglossus]|uniref:SUMO-interacting motif-containing protein 1 isoform X1 n=2 Tax=Hippoglossus hippoglossus TaxID=8267 RepID=UPI00148BD2D9|nr:SUMO-interacting motif-containing protein 1 isoform X1 [Hippoglossus hippoglossus]
MDVISVSSEDSDVEIVGSMYSAVPPPLSSDVTGKGIIDLTDPRWTFSEQRKRKRQYSTTILTVIDLTECEAADGTEEMKPSIKQDSTVFAPQQDCGDLKPELSGLDPQTQNQKKNDVVQPCDHTPVVRLRRLPFLEALVRDLETSKSSVHLTKDCTKMSLSFKQLGINNGAPESMITESNVQCMEPSLDESSPKVAESLIIEEQQENTNGFSSTHLHYLADHTSHHSPTTRLNPSELLDPDPLPHRRPVSREPQVDPPPTSEHTPAENTSERQSDEAEVERTSNSPDSYYSIPGEPSLSVSKTEDMDEGPGNEAYRGDLEADSPLSFFWQDESDEVNEDNRFHSNIMTASEEDRHFVCPDALREIMSGSYRGLNNVEYEAFGTPKVLCRQSLSQVYSTIEEDYPEGTLELLSDLLQPGFYPPRDISTHLLHNILLNPQRPHHLCVQAFNLLMRTQRHHMADKTTVPWDWELLTSVMANQDCTSKQCEVVRMFLEYVVQTLEDDLQAKRSVSALHRTITKATLSCDQQFPHVRDVIKWLFSSIMKSTEYGESREAVREKDEQIRMVLVFQRMLSLALEVDHSPALSSIKLAQELFHMLISSEPLRACRMLLLESLQSKLLTCKLLEHLLDYACPLKTSLPMSLSLLLHFLKNCTLTPDPTDGAERWKRWEELVHLLWMFLLSYNVAMKDFLCSSVSERRDRVSTMVYKPDDKISRSATHEAVDAFLSRSRADLGQALPLHVEESLAYLQNHLLDVCQC